MPDIQVSEKLILFLKFIPVFLISVTVHEFAHAFTADRLGDPTPRLMGRLTLNPLAHLDPLGTLMILLVRFGWGKPVEFDPFNLKNPRRDAALISLAGPVSNLLFAFILSLVIRLLPFSLSILQLLYPIIILNIILAIFNLLPLHPLDGFKIVGGFLPEEQAKEWQTLERYGLFFLLLLLIPINGTSTIYSLIGTLVNFFLSIFLGPSTLYF